MDKCYAPWGYFINNVYGQIMPCCNHVPNYMGNLNESSFEDIWNGPVCRNMRKKISEGNYTESGCYQCHLLKMGTLIKPYSIAVGDSKSKEFEDNYSLNLKEYEEGLEILKSKPLFLENTVNYNCNLRCVMCWQKEYPYGGELSQKAIAEMVKLYKYARVIMWVGGEPFMIKHIINYIRTFNSQEMPYQEFHTTTNGTLFDAAMQNEIKKFSTGNILFSIDGATKQTYEKIRNGANFEKVMANLRLAIKNDFVVGVNYVIMYSNFNEIPLMIDLAGEMGFLLAFYPICGKNMSENIFKNKELSAKLNVPLVMREAKNMAEKYKNKYCSVMDNIIKQLQYIENLL